MEGGPPGFTQDYTCPALLGMPLGAVCVHLPGCHRLWRAVPGRFGLASCSHVAVPQPQPCKHDWFGLAPVRSPLLRGSRLLSLPPGTEMFHFPGFPHTRLCVQRAATGHYASRVSPFGDPRIGACLTAPRGISQSAASFIGSWRQGIHRMPFVPWLFDAHARYGILKLPDQQARLSTSDKENRRPEDRRQPPRKRHLPAVYPRRS